MTHQPFGTGRLGIKGWVRGVRQALGQFSQLSISQPKVEVASLEQQPRSRTRSTNVISALQALETAALTVSEPAALEISESRDSDPPASETMTTETGALVLTGRDWTGLKVALILLAVPWTGAAAAYHWLATVPDSPNCQSPHWSQAEFEQLQCLQAKMQSGETQLLISGLRELKAWPENSPMASVAQRLLEDWSVVAWSEAQARYEAGQWEDSARLIAEIPEDFEIWTQAQRDSTLWQKVREQGDALYQRAEAAIQDQDWQQALGHAKALAGLDNDYWRQQGLHKLPMLIEEQQAAAGGQPLAATPLGPQQPWSTSETQPQPVADPRSTRPLRSRPIAPSLVSLTRPTVAQPGQRPPEFSAA